MSVILVATAFPLPEHRAEVIEAFEAAIPRAQEDPGCELYALHEGRDRLVMIEKYASQDALAEHSRSPVLAPHPVGDEVKGAL
jgi:quinol monooxygenase YgiN